MGLQLLASTFVLVVTVAAALTLHSVIGSTCPRQAPRVAFGALASVNVLMFFMLVASLKAMRDLSMNFPKARLGRWRKALLLLFAALFALLFLFRRI